jgi:hypothetical protein
MATSPAWSQTGGGGGGGTGATGSPDPGSDSSSSAPGSRGDNSGQGAQQPGNRAAPDTTNQRNQSPALPNASEPRAASPAPIQTPASPAARSGTLDMSGLREVDKNATISYNGLSASNLEDMNIVDPAGKKVGEIDRVLVSADNKPMAVVVDAGGILGIGGDKVVVGLDQLTLDSQKKQFVSQMDENQIKALPKYVARTGASPTGASPSGASPSGTSPSGTGTMNR